MRGLTYTRACVVGQFASLRAGAGTALQGGAARILTVKRGTHRLGWGGKTGLVRALEKCGGVCEKKHQLKGIDDKCMTARRNRQSNGNNQSWCTFQLVAERRGERRQEKNYKEPGSKESEEGKRLG